MGKKLIVWALVVMLGSLFLVGCDSEKKEREEKAQKATDQVLK